MLTTLLLKFHQANTQSAWRVLYPHHRGPWSPYSLSKSVYGHRETSLTTPTSGMHLGCRAHTCNLCVLEPFRAEAVSEGGWKPGKHTMPSVHIWCPVGLHAGNQCHSKTFSEKESWTSDALFTLPFSWSKCAFPPRCVGRNPLLLSLWPHETHGHSPKYMVPTGLLLSLQFKALDLWCYHSMQCN